MFYPLVLDLHFILGNRQKIIHQNRWKGLSPNVPQQFLYCADSHGNEVHQLFLAGFFWGKLIVRSRKNEKTRLNNITEKRINLPKNK